ncbi:zinc finger protein 181 [Musca vetustissima]|uniref:zinc finger protein 181 n=1 Tax=Musca vetustissima TaxID=27455 RepID=UPI002AB7EBED|nr:zinc finger protein 181 [Musca vetustissima]
MTANDVIDMPDDLSELCRVCLQIPEENQCLDLSMIYDEDDNLTYGECFTICTKINLNECNNLPHNLCKSCGLELQMSYDFYKKVEESKRSLEQYQQKMEEVTKQIEEFETVEETLEKNTELSMSNYVIAAETDSTKEPTIESSISMESLLQTYENGELETKSKDNQEIHTNIFVDNTDGGHHDCLDQHGNNDGITRNEIVQALSPTDVQEEHLDCDEFNIVEALEDEETQQSKLSTTNASQIVLHMDDNGEYFFEADNISEQQEHNSQYASVTMGNRDFDESSQDSQNLEDDTNRSWQDNVVAVANKEHIPLEMKNEATAVHAANHNNDEFAYELIEKDDGEEQGGNDEACVEFIEMIDNGKDVGVTSISRKRHFGEFACDYCHKVFPNFSRMITHRRCHEEDRPKFPCKYCGRVYATKQAMDCHIQTFHNKTGFQCDVCQKVFAIRRSLEVHMRFHTGDFPYACNLCDKKFAQLGHLNTHKNVRHNNVRFGCNYPDCGKFFTSSSSLRNHEFSHSAMPFECLYCQRGYPAKAKLKVHVKRKHNIELSKEQLEEMRKFHVARSKVNLVKVVPIEEGEEEEEEV